MKIGDFVIYQNPYDNKNYIVKLDEQYELDGIQYWCADNDRDCFFEIPINAIQPLKLHSVVRLHEGEEYEVDAKIVGIDYETEKITIKLGRNHPLERDWFNSEEEYGEYLNDLKLYGTDDTDVVCIYSVTPCITSGK